MTQATRCPVVGTIACSTRMGKHPAFGVGEKYIRAIAEGAGCLPVVFPPGPWADAGDVAAQIDGLFLTGSPSNVEPWRFEGPDSAPGTLHDPVRDATVLPLITAVLDAGKPLLAVCRGHQELNVALGGTLHQDLKDVPGKATHILPDTLSVEDMYAPVHSVDLAKDGHLAGIVGTPRIMVNSVHDQAIDRLAPGLAVEALSEDGIVEATRVMGATGFALSVQWHPEWRYWEDPASTALFTAFGDAVRAHATGAPAADRAA